MNPEEILRIFQDTGALLEGHFLLSSGLHSSQYLQCALILQHPNLASQLCGELARRFKEDKASVVIGPSFGGIIVSYEAGRTLGIRAIFSERQNGKMVLRRGLKITPEDRVLVVEDVITTGGSVREVIDLVQDLGAKVVGLGAIVDRSEKSLDLEIHFESLVKLDIQNFSADKCPLCKEGVALVKPGSRG